MPSPDLTRALQESVSQSRKSFVAAAAELRPRLHRFCARMVGSSLDGEDVVQETLADAFYNLASLKDPARFESWMLRIAYHKCIDHLRREERRQRDVSLDEEHDRAADDDTADPADTPIDEALATLVSELPPKERASVLLKDVLDYPLSEIADIADTTLGGVKAALHRGRAKLRAITAVPPVRTFDSGQRQLFEAYAECFNRRDWDALKHLVRADARLEIVGAVVGRMDGLGATYSGNYSALPHAWKLAVAVVDGDLVVVHWRRRDAVTDSPSESTWEPHAVIRLWSDGQQVVHIRDYIHVDYLLREARIASAP